MLDTRGEWVNLSGDKQDENISVAILDQTIWITLVTLPIGIP